MKLKSILLAAAACLFVAACDQKPDEPGLPYLTIDEQSDAVLLEFDSAQAEKTVIVKSNREWQFEALADDADWLDIAPAGKQAAAPKGVGVTVTVTKNTGADRKYVVNCSNGTKTVALTVKQKGEQGPSGEILEESFEESLGEFTIDDVNKPSGVNFIWAYASNFKCAKASAYVNKTNYESESWLVSPLVDLTGETAAYLNFDHAGNAYNEKGKANTVWVREGTDGTWTKLSVPQDHLYDAAFTFKNSGDIDLKDYLGKKIQIGFKYTSTSSKAGTWEVKNVKITRTAAPVVGPTVCTTIAEVKALGAGANMQLQNALAVQVNATGALLSDGTDYIYVYAGETPAFKLGDKLNITAAIAEYPANSGRLQLNPKGVEVLSSGNAVSYPTPKDITAEFDTYAPAGIEYVKVRGTLVVSGNYYNLNVDGATAKTGSLVSPADDLSTFNNMLCEVTGFYVYSTGSGSKYTNIAYTEIKPAGGFLSASPSTIKVPAEATTASFNIKSDQSWNIVSSTMGIEISPISGDGDAEVSLKFPSNAAFTEIKTTFTISCISSESVPAVTVTLVQAAMPDPNVTVLELTNAEICASLEAAVAGGANGYTTVDFTSASGTWSGLVNAQTNADKTLKTTYVQMRNKNGSHLLSPKFSSAVEKIEFSLTEGMNEGQKRILFAMPANTDLPASAAYTEALYKNEYGSVETSGPGTYTLSFAADTDTFMLIVKGGATYIDNIKVYLK
ncbi:MAG: choice-of-anchor J domain-containing protein [Bacteroidales bacterium]|nr:choice-of-anchor J domain-containing protein [Bacteroidales bacterium]